jgi:hypothetical protein
MHFEASVSEKSQANILAGNLQRFAVKAAFVAQTSGLPYRRLVVGYASARGEREILPHGSASGPAG